MRDQEWDSTATKLDTLDLAQLVLGLLVLDSVDGESTLGIVDETEVLASLLNGDDVHEAGGEGGIGADLAVDLDKSLHQDGLDLAVVESILESVSDEDDQGHAVAELVRTGRRLGSVGAGQLVKQPVRGGAEALLVLLAIEIVRCWVSNSGAAREKPRSCFDFAIAAMTVLPISSTHIPRAIVSVGWFVGGDEEDGREGPTSQRTNLEDRIDAHFR